MLTLDSASFIIYLPTVQYDEWRGLNCDVTVRRFFSMNKNHTENLYTLSEACELLSISTATGRNWMKAGRLISVSENGQKPLFDEKSLFALKNALSDGNISALKSRRNKTYISNNVPVLDDVSLRCNLRCCAEQLIFSAGYADFSLYQPLLDDLIDADCFGEWKATSPECGTAKYAYVPEEDTLGLLYQSLCHIGDRKSSGSYYTPGYLAKNLVDNHLPMLKPNHTILDPSCGTGIFLLQLPNILPLHNIYGNDINPLSVALTRINLALKYHVTTRSEIETLRQNISVSNFLSAVDNKTTIAPETSVLEKTYDFILGNPPWGAKLSSEEKNNYRDTFSCASGSSVEIFDLFIEQSLRLLSSGGILSFVLPEAILTVKTHKPIRKLLMQNTSVRSVEYLGEVFEQVHCPSIIFTVSKELSVPFFKNVIIKRRDKSVFSTRVEHTVSADSFSFSLTDEEYLLLEKISVCPNHSTLVDNSVFALGIVTGNNAEHIHPSPAPGLEPIIKGSDISKYHINSHAGYIAFAPDKLQQTAPAELYRAPEKLFYRFINKHLIFSYDNTGLLSLNSCNILIPQIPGLSVKYVLAVLNSSVAQFVFEKKFKSVKVLRSHLEQIPIPIADEKAQREIVAMVDTLINAEETSKKYVETYKLLDRKIADIYGLDAEAYSLICR